MNYYFSEIASAARSPEVRIVEEAIASIESVEDERLRKQLRQLTTEHVESLARTTARSIPLNHGQFIDLWRFGRQYKQSDTIALNRLAAKYWKGLHDNLEKSATITRLYPFDPNNKGRTQGQCEVFQGHRDRLDDRLNAIFIDESEIGPDSATPAAKELLGPGKPGVIVFAESIAILVDVDQSGEFQSAELIFNAALAQEYARKLRRLLSLRTEIPRECESKKR